MKVTPEGVEAMVVAEIDNPAFCKRSPQYRQGVKDCLLNRFYRAAMPTPEVPGTPEFDAYDAGWVRGSAMYDAWREEHKAEILRGTA